MQMKSAAKVLWWGMAFMVVPAFGNGRSTKRVPPTSTHVKNTAKAKQKAKQVASRQRNVLVEDEYDAEERQAILKAQRRQARNDQDLITAIQRGDVAAVKRLVKADANVHALTPAQEPLLHVAIKGGHREIIESLLLAGAAILSDKTFITDYPPFSQITTKHVATNVKKQNALMVAEKVASPAIITLVRNFALLEVAQEVRTAAVKTLLEQGAEINATERYGRSPLFWGLYGITSFINQADRIRAREMALLLLERGANPNGRVYFRYENPNDPTAGQPILDWACSQGHWEAALILIDHGADVSIGKEGNSLLHSVISAHSEQDPKTRLQLIKVLLQRGLDVNARDAHGKTPLMLAKQNKHTSIVSLLLEHGATESVFHRRK
jgi:ankyrin repeat protein